jgi:hypothetical protein
MEEDVQYEMPHKGIINLRRELGVVTCAELYRNTRKPFLVFSLCVEYDNGGSGQEAGGGKVLGGIDEVGAEEFPSTLDFVRRMKNLFDVEELNDIVKKEVYVITSRMDGVWGLESLDGCTFFYDHWVVDNFPERENVKELEESIPIRNERVNKSAIGHRNRLDEVE